MAVTKFIPTDVYQLVSASVVILTIKKEGEGTLFISPTDSDDDVSYNFSSGSKGEQIEVRSTRDTFIRASGEGWDITVDEG